MNLGSWVVFIVLCVIVAFILRGIVRDIRSGKDPLCGQCGHTKGDKSCASCSASAAMLKNIKTNIEAAEAAKQLKDADDVHNNP